ncbi:MAG TPA: SMP-30/gluconolactonase/LRE family protein [Verrucomicrobiae bacterium]|jgi:gluconolactonase|nr:SMP-30/gluconolactonase/LRE family protein [Verrucomicrobiae bacterium]
MKRLLPLALFLAWIAPCSLKAQTLADEPVVKLDPSLDALISPDAKLELVKGGFGFTEGIVWVDQGDSGYMLLSDMYANVIYKLTPDGKVSLYLDHSGYTGYDIWRVGMPQPDANRKDVFFMIGSNGLALDRQGRLLIATWTGRSIDRIEKDGKRTILAERYDGKRFGGTNDLVVKKDGAVYFTDGFGGLRGRDKDPGRELDFAGIFMWKDGKVTLAIKDIATPNGLAFSPDEKYLYANGSQNKYVRRYDVQRDDTLTNSQMFIDMSSDTASGITDGMKVDTKGNVWESGPRGIWIMSPEGKHLGTILTPEFVANLCFGDRDNKTLYVAARTGVYRIRVNVPGIR